MDDANGWSMEVRAPEARPIFGGVWICTAATVLHGGTVGERSVSPDEHRSPATQ